MEIPSEWGFEPPVVIIYVVSEISAIVKVIMGLIYEIQVLQFL